MNSGTWGFLVLLLGFAVSNGGLGSALLSTSTSPLLRHIAERAEGLLTPLSYTAASGAESPAPALPSQHPWASLLTWCLCCAIGSCLLFQAQLLMANVP